MDGREARGRVCVCLVRRRLRLPIEGSSRNAMVSGDVGFGRAEGYSWWSSSQKFVKSRRQNVDPVRALAGQGPEFVSLIGWLPSPSLDRWKLHCPCPRLPDKLDIWTVHSVIKRSSTFSCSRINLFPRYLLTPNSALLSRRHRLPGITAITHLALRASSYHRRQRRVPVDPFSRQH